MTGLTITVTPVHLSVICGHQKQYLPHLKIKYLIGHPTKVYYYMGCLGFLMLYFSVRKAKADKSEGENGDRAELYQTILHYPGVLSTSPEGTTQKRRNSIGLQVGAKFCQGVR